LPAYAVLLAAATANGAPDRRAVRVLSVQAGQTRMVVGDV